MSAENQPSDNEPTFGTTPITDKALYEWMENGQGRTEPESITEKAPPEVQEEIAASNGTSKSEHIVQLEAAVDTKLEDVYEIVGRTEEWDAETVKEFMRAAFERGYLTRHTDQGSFGLQFMRSKNK